MSRTLVDRLSRPALRAVAALLACTASADAHAHAHAQEDYPTRPVSMSDIQPLRSGPSRGRA